MPVSDEIMAILIGAPEGAALLDAVVELCVADPERAARCGGDGHRDQDPSHHERPPTPHLHDPPRASDPTTRCPVRGPIQERSAQGSTILAVAIVAAVALGPATSPLPTSSAVGRLDWRCTGHGATGSLAWLGGTCSHQGGLTVPHRRPVGFGGGAADRLFGR